MAKKPNIQDIDYFSIKIASPEEIMSWSHGEVEKPETLNYRTQRPEKDGLFSEKIFGPTKDYQCYCGKYKKARYKGIVCERCGVEVTHSRVRRERMGHIELAAPVVHIWFLKTMRSKLSQLLDTPVSKLEQVVYYSAYIVTEVDEENRKQALDAVEEEYKALKDKPSTDMDVLEDSRSKSKEILQSLEVGMIMSEEDHFTLSRKFGDVFDAGRGGEAVRKILKNMDLEKEKEKIQEEYENTRGKNRQKKLLRRLKLVDSFIKSKVKPEWMIMKVVPVMPPELRPMVPLDGGRYATADLNDLYRRVINRNNRLKKLQDLNSPDVILTNEKRMLQESVDSLIDNTRGSSKQVMNSRRRPLKSLADILKGKKGRFRRNLLGKRVDYSGRSVIVVGPDLNLNQCGLPKHLALEIFRPFVINQIIERELGYNIKQANKIIEQKTPEVWAILEDVIDDKMVLLNRAPTLHRLGIQAFEPVLIEDLAIRVHPLVCPAFNADFDGDQMAVHLPLGEEAQYECRELMDASKNLLKPASGEPIARPTQDIVLGCYYLTDVKEDAEGEGKVFSGYSEVDLAHSHDVVDLRAKIKVMVDDEIIETTYGRLIFNKVLPDDMEFINKKMDKSALSKVIHKVIEEYGIDESSQYLDAIKDLGFSYSTTSAISFGMEDTAVPEEKHDLIKEAEDKVAKVEDQFDDGLLTDEERSDKTIETWMETKNKAGDIVPEFIQKFRKGKDKDLKSNTHPIIDSGARGSWSQTNQIMGMRGIVANPKGESIELPIKSSYKEGLRVLEYFIATHGARKGLTDTALKTASSGYLTRRLVDVAQDLVVKKNDCRTKDGIEIIREEGKSYEYPFHQRLYSRTALNDIKDGRKILVREGEVIGRDAAEKIAEADIDSVEVRSPITCKTSYGICSKCYGLDLAKEEEVEEGEAVGVVAAQSIGEPGTQLTMRTFHAGGVAGVDITHGLPRVEEVFEVRNPKGKAVMSKVDGKVESIDDKDLLRIVKIKEEGADDDDKLIKYEIPKGVKTLVEEGDEIEEGDVISEGPLDLEEILEHRGVEALKRYIVNEVQKVYVPEGSTINDKHIEMIVRKMLSKVKVTDPGDTDLMMGELVDKSRLREKNRELRRGDGGSRAKAEQRVLGITKVSISTESFLSAASFQETSRVLVDAAIENKIDPLRGLKENVIIGKLIPAGTGVRGIPSSELDKDKE